MAVWTKLGEGVTNTNEDFVKGSHFFVDFGRFLKLDLDLRVILSTKLKWRSLESRYKEENLSFSLSDWVEILLFEASSEELSALK